jgi:hypothetical protein
MKTLVGPKTAILLYAVLILASFLTLKGTPLYLALLIVVGVAVKSLLHYLRNRLE